MNHRLTLLTACLLSASTFAFGDDASKLQKAKEYLRVTQADRQISQIGALLANQLQAQLGQQLAGANTSPQAATVIQDFQKSVGQLLTSTLTWENIRGEMEQLTMQTFTEPELDGMLTFYKSPAGKAMLEKQPMMTSGGSAIGTKHAQALQPKIQQLANEVNAKLKQLQAK